MKKFAKLKAKVKKTKNLKNFKTVQKWMTFYQVQFLNDHNGKLDSLEEKNNLLKNKS